MTLINSPKTMMPKHMPKKSIKFLGGVFIISTLLPFVGLPQQDSQPFPLLFAVLFLSACAFGLEKVQIRRRLIWYCAWVWFGCVASILLDAEITYLTARAILGYVAIFAYYTAFDNYLTRYGFPSRLLWILVAIWLLVGIVQIFYPNFTSNFVALRSSPDRGVTSLAPEPTYFAVFLFFACWLTLISTNYQRSLKNGLLCMLCLGGSLLLAKSSMIVVFYFISALVFILYLLLKDRHKLPVAILAMLLVIFALSFLPLEGTRLWSFIVSIREGDLSFFLQDESANERVSAVAIPFLSLLDNHLLPGGFNGYIADGSRVAKSLWPLFPYNISDKIMSWNLAMWYELGIFGLVAWLNLFNLKRCNLRGVMECMLLALLLFSAIPHLFPVPIMVLALISFKNSKLENTIK